MTEYNLNMNNIKLRNNVKEIKLGPYGVSGNESLK